MKYSIILFFSGRKARGPVPTVRPLMQLCGNSQHTNQKKQENLINLKVIFRPPGHRIVTFIIPIKICQHSISRNENRGCATSEIKNKSEKIRSKNQTLKHSQLKNSNEKGGFDKF